MINGKAVFPGSSTLNQIEKIMSITGMPSKNDIDSVESELANKILGQIKIQKRIGFTATFTNASKEARDLLRRLLQFNPKKRLTVLQVLKHPYVAQFSSPEDEISCEKIITIPINDNKKFSIQKYRDSLYEDISKRKQEQRRKWQKKYLESLNITAEDYQKQKMQVRKRYKQEKQQKQQKQMQQKQMQQNQVQNKRKPQQYSQHQKQQKRSKTNQESRSNMSPEQVQAYKKYKTEKYKQYARYKAQQKLRQQQKQKYQAGAHQKKSNNHQNMANSQSKYSNNKNDVVYYKYKSSNKKSKD